MKTSLWPSGRKGVQGAEVVPVVELGTLKVPPLFFLFVFVSPLFFCLYSVCLILSIFLEGAALFSICGSELTFCVV